MKTPVHRMANLLAVFLLVALSCSLPSTPSLVQPETGETPTPTEAGPTEVPGPVANRIGIRSVDGEAEFYDTGSGEKFVPIGVNYVDFYPTGSIGYQDSVMATNVYDPDRVRAAFRQLNALGYNTVRIFFDNCEQGPYCFGNASGSGLNPGYLDNMVDLMHVAAQEGIYIIFTANTAPGAGGYWAGFDLEFYGSDHPGFESAFNADWLHPAGVNMKKRAWTDLMSGLAARNAPFEAVLGWQLTNEYWLWKNVPPLSLESGLVTISNGQTYDMADPQQKRQMITDGTLFFMETIVPIIKQHDPDALTTMGFFAPQFPHETGIGGDWYVDTAPLLQDAPVDFWDFHAYADADLTIAQQAENFGILGYYEKPVVMGETGAGHAFVPSAQSAATLTARWIADSCAVGFDGWLYWGYYPWPDDMGGKPWAPLEADAFLLNALAPVNHPDPCQQPEFDVANVSHGKPVRYSAQTSDRRADFAVDGGAREWAAGSYPPHWIEVDLQAPTTVGQVGFTVGQWPPGDTHHQVWARLQDNRLVLLADFNGFTTVEMSRSYQLPVPVEGVTSVRFLQLSSPSWAGYREIEVISSPANGTACIARATGTIRIFNHPSEGAREVGVLKNGDLIHAGAAYADDASNWVQIGSTAWIQTDRLTLPEGCDLASLPKATPGPRLVPVTFAVDVPESTTGEVFVAGYFKGTDLPPWIPYMILLKKSSDGDWTTTLDLPVGTQVSYVYTRSSWESIGRPAGCPDDTPPIEFTVIDGPPIIRNDVVPNWRDLDC